MAIRDFAQTKTGLKLRYEIRGNGDPVALIMGFSGSGRGWGEPFLKQMESRFKIFVIDNRGTGESDKPDEAWTIDGHGGGCRGGARPREDAARAYLRNLDGRNDRAGIRAGASRSGCAGWCWAARTAAPAIRLPPIRHVAKLMPDPKLSAEQQAQRAFSVACGKTFLNSQPGRRLSTGDRRHGQISQSRRCTPSCGKCRRFGMGSVSTRLAEIKVADAGDSRRR